VTGTSQAAGILGHARSSSVLIENCTNKGVVTSTYTAADGGTSYAAGIFGSTPTADGHYCMVRIVKCLNEGNVTSKNSSAAGIAGYVWCGGQNGNYIFGSVIDCVNKGDVQAGSFASQLFAYTNDTRTMEEGQKQNTTITGVGLGTVSRCAEAKREPTQFYDAFVGLSSSTKGANYNINVILSDADTPDWFTYAESDDYKDNRSAFSNRPDTLQLVSAADAAAASAAIANLGYQAPAAPSDPTAPTTGDTAVWFAVAGVVALIGMAAAFRTCKQR
ncbi:MAG: hypothetical protein J6V48_00900, partial [Clostridia bacterium]|nr:hypothetical protein [Clostridia bacterium]